MLSWYVFLMVSVRGTRKKCKQPVSSSFFKFPFPQTFIQHMVHIGTFSWCLYYVSWYLLPFRLATQRTYVRVNACFCDIFTIVGRPFVLFNRDPRPLPQTILVIIILTAHSPSRIKTK